MVTDSFQRLVGGVENGHECMYAGSGVMQNGHQQLLGISWGLKNGHEYIHAGSSLIQNGHRQF
jgi:hypothetical protein